MTFEDSQVLFDVPRDWWHLRQCPVCHCRLQQQMTHTYVVQRQGWVKIGATSNLRRRIGELARPAWTKHLLSPVGMDWLEPLVTLGVIEDDVEHHLHERFADCHVVGEWFFPSADMRVWLTTLNPNGAPA